VESLFQDRNALKGFIKFFKESSPYPVDDKIIELPDPVTALAAKIPPKYVLSLYTDYFNLKYTEKLENIPKDLRKKYKTYIEKGIIPFKEEKDKICVYILDPTSNWKREINGLEFASGKRVEAYTYFPSELKRLVEGEDNVAVDVNKLRESVSGFVSDEDAELITLDEAGYREGDENDAQIITLVNSLIVSALKKGASDVHFEPFSNRFRVRFRIDGVLKVEQELPKEIHAPVTARLKVMSGLDLTERRRPQDGRMRIRYKGKTVDFRVSTVPVVYGEKTVLRVLDKGNLKLDLSMLGLEDREYNLLLNAIRQPYGMILVTGPTGSGKTTTLYSSLMTINTPEVNIMTAEDPVEYDLDGINQVQVNPQIGFRFSDALRAFLRQDPDVILVGEIRDTETAEIAVEAALTGHLLFSTLHTNSAAETITRLEEMGVERYLISSSLILIVAQRLARKICPYCKKEVKVKPEVLIELGVPPEKAQELVETKKFYKGTGCPKCDGSGYKGRVGLYEVMEITPKIREMIIEGKSALEISRQAQKEGMRTLRQMGILKVLKGETTPEEVMRVTR